MSCLTNDDPAERHYVIVGNGAAGNSAAVALREGDASGRITVVSDEFFPFYHRHRLRDFVTGNLPESGLAVHRDEGCYARMGVRLRLGQRVERVDFSSRTLFLDHLETVNYTRLLLAVGGRSRIPEPLWGLKEHFTVMKTVEDARRMRARLETARHVFAVGGDLVGFRLASGLLEMGKSVTFMVDKDSFWPLELAHERRTEFAEKLRGKGAHVIIDDRITGVTPAKNGYSVRTAGGREVFTDMVGAFFGCSPSIDFLLGSGLDIDRGILADEHLQTSVPGVYAAGDCAQVFNPSIQSYWTSVGLPNAEALGAIAARNMLGGAVAAEKPKYSILSLEGVRVVTPWWREY